jgi:dihydroorotase
LEKLHRDFPKLKIVLEHATTKAAVSTVSKLGPSVGCTITLHHLVLTVDDWAGCGYAYCKPVAKYPSDREALREIIKDGNKKFFLGSDSAPHPKNKKEGAVCAAGVFTGAYLLPSVLHVFEEFGALDKVESFCCRNGREFFGSERIQRALDSQLATMASEEQKKILISRQNTQLKVEKKQQVITDSFQVKGSQDKLIPFWAGKTLNWNIFGTTCCFSWFVNFNCTNKRDCTIRPDKVSIIFTGS